MSRATVRSAITSYLENANVEYLTSVKPFPPKLTLEGEFYSGADPNHTSGCIIFLWIESERENRIALGGAHNGRKVVEYSFIMDCYFRSVEPQSEDAAAQNEAFLDSLIAAIRADRNAGAPGVVFVWGEGPHPQGNGPDIEVTSYYPRNLKAGSQLTQTYSNIRVMVLEEIDS